MYKIRNLCNLLYAQDGGTGGGSDPTPTPAPKDPTNAPVAIDYEKLASIVEGRANAAGDTALKKYFEQQGLTGEEMQAAIKQFKDQKAAKAPDVQGMQTQIADAQKQLSAAQAQVQKAQVESTATIVAVKLGVDAKSIPYILKMADFNAVIDKDGKISDEAVTGAINKVLEDVPALKPSANETGFTQVGIGGDPSQRTQQNAAKPQATKRWNRWN